MFKSHSGELPAQSGAVELESVQGPSLESVQGSLLSPTNVKTLARKLFANSKKDPKVIALLLWRCISNGQEVLYDARGEMVFSSEDEYLPLLSQAMLRYPEHEQLNRVLLDVLSGRLMVAQEVLESLS